ncbi:MAG: hypothetical protein E6343_09000 [Clostridium perfringens]|nr:hypothetical protein [Clostridium perfringens]
MGIWCAKDYVQGKRYIVGCYKNATVCRNYFYDEDLCPKNICKCKRLRTITNE